MNSAVSEEKVAASLLSEALHPGGLRLTSRAARLAGISPGMKLLDIGCGTGAALEYLSQEFAIEPYGIDISAEMISIAARRLKTEGLFVGDAAALPFTSAFFSAVICECTLSLLESTGKAYREIYRVLVPGGLFISSDVCDFCDTKPIKAALDANGFDLICFEDHRPALITYIAEMKNRQISPECMSSQPQYSKTQPQYSKTQPPGQDERLQTPLPLYGPVHTMQTPVSAPVTPPAQMKRATYYLAVCRRR